MPGACLRVSVQSGRVWRLPRRGANVRTSVGHGSAALEQSAVRAYYERVLWPLLGLPLCPPLVCLLCSLAAYFILTLTAFYILTTPTHSLFS